MVFHMRSETASLPEPLTGHISRYAYFFWPDGMIFHQSTSTFKRGAKWWRLTGVKEHHLLGLKIGTPLVQVLVDLPEIRGCPETSATFWGFWSCEVLIILPDIITWNPLMTPVLLGKDLVLNGETAPEREDKQICSRYKKNMASKIGRKPSKLGLKRLDRPFISPFKKTPMENSLQNPINNDVLIGY